MNDRDKHNLKLLLSHCRLMESHVKYFGDDIDEYMSNEHYQAACGFELLEIGEISIDYQMTLLKNMTK